MDRKKSDKSYQVWFQSCRVLPIEWVIAGIIGGLILITYTYADGVSWTIWSTNLLDVIFDGKPLDYYAYCRENLFGAMHKDMGTSVFSVLPWAVWNIPIWILQRFFGFRIVENSLMLIWSKLFLVAALLVTAYFMYQIVLLMTGNRYRSWLAALLMVSAVHIYIAVCFAGQNDVVICMFGVMAVYFLLKKRYGLFMLLSSFAIATKPFFIFTYIGLVLFIEKRVDKIIYRVLGGFWLTILFSLIYHNAPLYQKSIKGAIKYGDEIGKILSKDISFGPVVNTSIFILILCLVYFFAYVVKTKGDEQWRQYVIYIAMATQFVFFGFTEYFYYRLILLYPFLLCVILTNKKYLRLNMILEVLLSASAVLVHLNTNGFMGPSYVARGFLANFLPGINTGKLHYVNLNQIMWSVKNYALYSKIFNAVFIACLILLLVINFPGFKKDLGKENDVCSRGWIWLHMALIIPVYAVSLALCF
ncbi:hypothetical protein [Diplocloster modestus]|uniref:DUF2029 domain-containing protein n=1 Tax=Diplocloster modestus TaxID=2850322 RepID=A0ABS6K417_9FIRM|nr:hypothetical protein [Diplocloster modestus]MBU9725274.1 hypothetical protein [Diplocloster modestus]